MAAAYTPKVGQIVTYYSAAVPNRPRPAVVTSVINATHVNLRVIHTTETAAGAARVIVPPWTAGTWRRA
jgi:hypothetical protein